MQRDIAVILYGAPGAGKGTQANLLAARYGLIHLDTGKLLESIVHDPRRQHEKIVKRERKLFDAGKLMTPSFVSEVVIREARQVQKAGFGLIFSGFPRTVSEAEEFYPILRKLYGKHVYAFELVVSPEKSVKRNGSRMMCSVCGYALLTAYYPIKYPKYCPVCGGKFYKRTLDDPKIIPIRLEEYRKRTEPIFAIMKKQGYKLKVLDAKPAPYKIFRKIVGIIGG